MSYLDSAHTVLRGPARYTGEHSPGPQQEASIELSWSGGNRSGTMRLHVRNEIRGQEAGMEGRWRFQRAQKRSVGEEMGKARAAACSNLSIAEVPRL